MCQGVPAGRNSGPSSVSFWIQSETSDQQSKSWLRRSSELGAADRSERVHDLVEFPKVDPKYQSRRNCHVYVSSISEPAEAVWFGSVVKPGLEGGTSQRYLKNLEDIDG